MTSFLPLQEAHEVFVVGVSNNANQTQLRALAGPKGNVFSITNFDSVLHHLTPHLHRVLCPGAGNVLSFMRRVFS